MQVILDLGDPLKGSLGPQDPWTILGELLLHMTSPIFLTLHIPGQGGRMDAALCSWEEHIHHRGTHLSGALVLCTG